MNAQQYRWQSMREILKIMADEIVNEEREQLAEKAKLELKLQQVEAQAASMREALTAGFTRYIDGRVMCIRCGPHWEGHHDSDTCEVAAAISSDAGKDLLERHAREIREAVEREREECAKWWDDTEARSAEAHAVYQQEAHRRGDVRHPDAYSDLSEATKEWDRVLVRWVASAIRARCGK